MKEVKFLETVLAFSLTANFAMAIVINSFVHSRRYWIAQWKHVIRLGLEAGVPNEERQ